MYLCDELLLKLVEELQVLVIISRQSLFSHNSLHGLGILTNSITRVQLGGSVQNEIFGK